MDSVILLDQDSNKMNVDVVRYFQAGGHKYLIYTLNERDESDYVKLYAVKINDDFSAEKIEDEEDWNSFKELIKKIVRENKDGALLSAEDLNIVELPNIKVGSYRLFKLAQPIVELLGSNKKVFPAVEEYKPTSFAELMGETPSMEMPQEESFEEQNSMEEQTVEEPVAQETETEEQMAQVPEVEDSVANLDDEELPSKDEDYELPVAEPQHNLPEDEEEEFEPDYATDKEEKHYSDENSFPEINYEKLYLEQKNLNEKLTEELNYYKDKLENIKNML